MTYKCLGDERLIVMAEDRLQIPTEVSEPALARAEELNLCQATRWSMVPAPAERTRTETVLIIGWNELVGALLVELDKTVGRNSQLIIFSPQPKGDRQQFLEAAQLRRKHKF